MFNFMLYVLDLAVRAEGMDRMDGDEKKTLIIILLIVVAALVIGAVSIIRRIKNEEYIGRNDS